MQNELSPWEQGNKVVDDAADDAANDDGDDDEMRVFFVHFNTNILQLQLRMNINGRQWQIYTNSMDWLTMVCSKGSKGSIYLFHIDNYYDNHHYCVIQTRRWLYVLFVMFGCFLPACPKSPHIVWFFLPIDQSLAGFWHLGPIMQNNRIDHCMALLIGK